MHTGLPIDLPPARRVILVGALGLVLGVGLGVGLGLGGLVAMVTGGHGEPQPEVRQLARHAQRRPQVAGPEAARSPLGARRCVASPSAAEREADSPEVLSAGVCVLRVEAPSAIDLELSVDFVLADAEQLAAFRRTQSPRVLDDWVETLSLEWQADAGRVEVAEGDALSEVSASVVADSVAIEWRVEWRVEGLPTGERLAVVAYPGTAGAFPPFAVELEALRPGTVARVDLVLRPRGALRGQVELPPGSDPLDFYDVELHPAPAEDETPWSSDEMRFSLSNLRAGWQPLAALTANEGAAWRRQWLAEVRDGCVTQLSPWRLAQDLDALRVRVIDEAGQPVEGQLTAEFATQPRAVFAVSASGRFTLRGDWSGLELVSFDPDRVELRQATWAQLALRAPASVEIELVCAARSERAVRFWLRPDRPDTGSGELHNNRSAVSWARVRRAAGEPWRPVSLGYSLGCVSVYSAEFDSGPHEILAWIPAEGLACQTSIEVPSLALARGDPGGDTQYGSALPLDLRFEDPATRVCGILAPRLGDEPIQTSFESGPFELRGLPPDVPLVLVWFDGARELARHAVHLRRGETLDLGTLAIDCR